jgi:hypothetical protein
MLVVYWIFLRIKQVYSKNNPASDEQKEKNKLFWLVAFLFAVSGVKYLQHGYLSPMEYCILQKMTRKA